MKPIVAILFGGNSAEHDVSLKSATNIYNGINKNDFEPQLLGLDKKGNWRFNSNYCSTSINLTQKDYFFNAAFVYLRKCALGVEIVEVLTNQILSVFQVAFPIIHGNFGEDGTLQGILRSLNIPFVGPNLLGSAIGMDKDVTKRLLRDANIPIADYFTIDIHNQEEYTYEAISQKLGLPLFVKPASAGSSVGVAKVTNYYEYQKAIANAFIHDKKLLVEEAILGKEIECAVLGNTIVQSSVLGEIVTDTHFYSYEDKYLNTEGIRTKIPAEIDDEVEKELKTIAIKAFRILCCEGMSRVDFFLRKNNTFVLNEINTLPGFTATSMYPQLWEKSGLPLAALLSNLITLAFERHQKI